MFNEKDKKMTTVKVRTASVYKLFNQQDNLVALKGSKKFENLKALGLNIIGDLFHLSGTVAQTPIFKSFEIDETSDLAINIAKLKALDFKKETLTDKEEYFVNLIKKMIK